MTAMSDAATYRRIRRAIEGAADASAITTTLQGTTELSSSAALQFAREHMAATAIHGVSVTVIGATIMIEPARAQAAA